MYLIMIQRELSTVVLLLKVNSSEGLRRAIRPVVRRTESSLGLTFESTSHSEIDLTKLFCCAGNQWGCTRRSFRLNSNSAITRKDFLTLSGPSAFQ